MTQSNAELQGIWDAFLERWPLEKLPQLTLEEYTASGTNDSFAYWLEMKTDKLGSFWGGSSFKFGIFSRKAQDQKESGGGSSYTDDYAWYSKYGDTVDTAYARVLSLVIQVATAAREGRLEDIDDIDLGPAFKWKLAFLYQNPAHPIVLPILKPEVLRRELGELAKAWKASRLHRHFSERRGSESVFEQATAIWGRYQEWLSQQLSPTVAQEWLASCGLFSPIKEPTKYVAGFQTTDGRQLALMREPKTVSLFLSPGNWLEAVQDKLESVSPYSATASRNSNLGANASQLAAGYPAVSVKVPTLEALIALAEAYAGDTASLISPALAGSDIPVQDTPMVTSAPLNQILFGPPGTGKTYATIEAALEVLDPAFLVAHAGEDQREARKRRFDELVAERLIRFVTFHQSLSYEDFVEGLRAHTEEGKLTYEVEEGIFKAICSDAAARVTVRNEANISLEGRRIWKMSLGNTQGEDAYVYDQCITENYILLGYGGAADYTGCSSREEIFRRFQAIEPEAKPGDFTVQAVDRFLKMKKGDLVVVSEGNLKFRAIGEITGDYRSLGEESYGQCRAVKWLRVYSPSLSLDQLMNKKFSQATIYELKPGVFDQAKLESLLSAKDDVGERAGRPHVLIIDEINRGNVSRIFGELITLIEPSKRAGAAESLSVMLPYSKESFSVPDNVYLIGTMNTADRSLAGLDIALRRRFVFREMPARPELLDEVTVEGIPIGALLRVMNARIEVLLDRDHCLGHAYFMSLAAPGGNTLEALAMIFRQQILPLLQEYFFEDWQRIQWVLNDHRKAPENCFVYQASRDAQSLFGEGVNVAAHNLPWAITEDAFDRTEAYLGIIDHEQVLAGAQPSREANHPPYVIRQLSTGTIEVIRSGQAQSPVKPVLREIAGQLNVSHWHDNGVQLTTRQLGKKLIAAIEANA